MMTQDTNSSQTALRAVIDWLFRGSRLYMISKPDRILKQSKIHWDRQTVDLEGADGELLYDVPWDDVEFVDPPEFHFPEEPI